MGDEEKQAVKAAPERKKIWTPKVIISTIALCTSGTFSIMSLKIQGTSYTFKHSMLQTFLMFLGEYLNLIVFALPLMFNVDKLKTHFVDLQRNAKRTKRALIFTKLWAAFPCLLDAFGSGLSITSLLLLPASVCQMLQGGQIVTTCLFSKWINNRPILRHHFAGVLFSSVGFILVGLAGYIATTGGDSEGNYTVGGFFLGVVFMILNLVLQAIQSNVEERIMTKNAIPPMRMVGLEGLFGIIWMFAVLVVLSYIPCPNSQLCDIGGYTEDVATGLKALFAQPMLVMWCCITIFAIFFVNLNGMILIQNVSAVFRVFWSNTTTIFVWAICLIVGYESFVAVPFLVQLIGFSCLVTGNFTYNEVIRIKFMDLDRDLEPEAGAQPEGSLAKTVDSAEAAGS